MLNDRERRVLARIERQLRDTDPHLAQLFDGSAPSDPGVTPRFLLVTGLALLLLGTVLVAVPVAVAGMVLSGFSLLVAHTRPAGFGYA